MEHLHARILIVDEQEAYAGRVGGILQADGEYTIRAAVSGHQALEMLTGYHPDIILLSVALPDMDGYEVCRRIRRNIHHRFIRVIMISGQAALLPRERLEGYKVGADDYIEKHLQAEELQAKIRVILRLTQADEVQELRAQRKQTEDALRKSEEKYRALAKIGLALTAERDPDKLLELIIKEARNLATADGGTLYLLDDEKQHLDFKILQNDSMGLKIINVRESQPTFPPIPLFLDGKPNYTNVASYVALNDEVVGIPDVYKTSEFDFIGPKKYDAATGYRSKSMLVVPVKNRENEILGVIQLINARDPETGEVIAFNCAFTEVINSLASQAAMALINMKLMAELKELLYSFIKSIATAIDEKSPFTGGHIKRVYLLTMMLADQINNCEAEPFAAIHFTEEEMEELRLAAWMHDIGKITVPEHVIDKETKLQAIFKRSEHITTRFQLIGQIAENTYLQEKVRCLGGEGGGGNLVDLEQRHRDFTRELADALQFIQSCDNGSTFMTDEMIFRLRQIAARSYTLAGETYPWLTDNELDNLCIRKGTLNTKERGLIENHTTVTWKMLSQLPFPKNMANIPRYACGHHERLDGSGYHLGLSADKISLQMRILAIADIFEALTAKDRPYRQPMKLSKALEIMNSMKNDGHIDSAILELFITSRLYADYAAREMAREQIDI